MADEAGAATAQVMVYVANELQGVFSHISKALTEYQETGDLPDSVFEAEPAATAPTKRKRQKKDKDRVKRKPSAFNHYVKEQIAVLRARPQTDEEHNNNCKLQILTSCTLEKHRLLFVVTRAHLDGVPVPAKGWSYSWR
jgi:hypothetical protein